MSDAIQYAYAPAPASMRCPKCGFHQPQGPECARCGIFVAKFSDARFAHEQRATAVADQGFFAPEKKGIQHGMAGGLGMMTLAVVWFGLGWMGGVVFYYPPVLFLIGAFAFVKGLITGNVAG